MALVLKKTTTAKQRLVVRMDGWLGRQVGRQVDRYIYNYTIYILIIYIYIYIYNEHLP